MTLRKAKKLIGASRESISIFCKTIGFTSSINVLIDSLLFLFRMLFELKFLDFGPSSTLFTIGRNCRKSVNVIAILSIFKFITFYSSRLEIFEQIVKRQLSLWKVFDVCSINSFYKRLTDPPPHFCWFLMDSFSAKTYLLTDLRKKSVFPFAGKGGPCLLYLQLQIPVRSLKSV